MKIYIWIFLLIGILDAYGIGAVLLLTVSKNPTDMESIYSEKNLHTPSITFEDNYIGGDFEDNYSDLVNDDTSNISIMDDKRSSRIHVYRSGCIRRNGACDHRPHDCCFRSSCRCNLWGSNCRCQRMGLFQKWG